MEHKIIHEVKLKMDPQAAKQQQEVEGHASDGLHLMRPLIDPITGQEIEGAQTQEAGDALYGFTGNFAGASASTQGQATTNPTALKEAMECHYDDCKCIKQENSDQSAQVKPCSGKHCNCTCKTHKIVITHKKEHVGRIHKCPHCEFTSKRSDNVRRHMLRHTGERPHKCPHCDFSAKRPHSLKKHIENIHNKDLRTDGIVR
nr:zinc finger protein 513-like [Penaeus vannamei]